MTKAKERDTDLDWLYDLYDKLLMTQDRCKVAYPSLYSFFWGVVCLVLFCLSTLLLRFEGRQGLSGSKVIVVFLIGLLFVFGVLAIAPFIWIRKINAQASSLDDKIQCLVWCDHKIQGFFIFIESYLPLGIRLLMLPKPTDITFKKSRVWEALALIQHFIISLTCSSILFAVATTIIRDFFMTIFLIATKYYEELAPSLYFSIPIMFISGAALHKIAPDTIGNILGRLYSEYSSRKISGIYWAILCLTIILSTAFFVPEYKLTDIYRDSGHPIWQHRAISIIIVAFFITIERIRVHVITKYREKRIRKRL